MMLTLVNCGFIAIICIVTFSLGISYDQTCLHGFCYMMSSSPASYSQAQVGCNSGYNLVEITSSQIQTDLASILNGLTNDYYIGLSDKIKEGNFVWESGAPMLYSNFNSNKNNNGNDCVYLSRVNDWKWNTGPCSHSHRFICAMEDAITTTYSETTQTETTEQIQSETTTEAQTSTSMAIINATSETMSTTEKTTQSETDTTIPDGVTTSISTEKTTDNEEGDATSPVNSIQKWNVTSIQENSSTIIASIQPVISAELQQLYNELAEETVNIKIKQRHRQKISVSDNRPLCQAIGYSGIIIIAIMATATLILDLPRFHKTYRYIHKY